MQELTDIEQAKKEAQQELIRVELGDWLFNAGILGLIKILSWPEWPNINDNVKIAETYIEFDRSIFEGYTDRFFETAFRFHGKYDSIVQFLKEIQREIEGLTEDGDIDRIAKIYRIENPDEEKIAKRFAEEISKRWKGVAYESFYKVKKSDFESLEATFNKVSQLLDILQEKRDFFVQKEVQTFLRGIIGSGSFLNKSVSSNQKKAFSKDFEIPLLSNANPKEKKYNCIHCNSRRAKKNTIFSTGLVFYQGLNKDSVNFVWEFDPNLPLCEICELVYFCHWAGFTKGFNNKSYLFVNDDSDIQELKKKNELLSSVLNKDRQQNLLYDYFSNLLLQQEKEKSLYALQNIAIIEVDLQKDIMPKVISLHVSRQKAEFIRDNHEKLKWQASKV